MEHASKPLILVFKIALLLLTSVLCLYVSTALVYAQGPGDRDGGMDGGGGGGWSGGGSSSGGSVGDNGSGPGDRDGGMDGGGGGGWSGGGSSSGGSVGDNGSGPGDRDGGMDGGGGGGWSGGQESKGGDNNSNQSSGGSGSSANGGYGNSVGGEFEGMGSDGSGSPGAGPSISIADTFKNTITRATEKIQSYATSVVDGIKSSMDSIQNSFFGDNTQSTTDTFANLPTPESVRTNNEPNPSFVQSQPDLKTSDIAEIEAYLERQRTITEAAEAAITRQVSPTTPEVVTGTPIEKDDLYLEVMVSVGVVNSDGFIDTKIIKEMTVVDGTPITLTKEQAEAGAVIDVSYSCEGSCDNALPHEQIASAGKLSGTYQVDVPRTGNIVVGYAASDADGNQTAKYVDVVVEGTPQPTGISSPATQMEIRDTRVAVVRTPSTIAYGPNPSNNYVGPGVQTSDTKTQAVAAAEDAVSAARSALSIAERMVANAAQGSEQEAAYADALAEYQAAEAQLSTMRQINNPTELATMATEITTQATVATSRALAATRANPNLEIAMEVGFLGSSGATNDPGALFAVGTETGVDYVSDIKVGDTISNTGLTVVEVNSATNELEATAVVEDAFGNRSTLSLPSGGAQPTSGTPEDIATTQEATMDSISIDSSGAIVSNDPSTQTDTATGNTRTSQTGSTNVQTSVTSDQSNTARSTSVFSGVFDSIGRVTKSISSLFSPSAEVANDSIDTLSPTTVGYSEEFPDDGSVGLDDIVDESNQIRGATEVSLRPQAPPTPTPATPFSTVVNVATRVAQNVTSLFRDVPVPSQDEVDFMNEAERQVTEAAIAVKEAETRVKNDRVAIDSMAMQAYAASLGKLSIAQENLQTIRSTLFVDPETAVSAFKELEQNTSAATEISAYASNRNSTIEIDGETVAVGTRAGSMLREAPEQYDEWASPVQGGRIAGNSNWFGPRTRIDKSGQLYASWHDGADLTSVDILNERTVVAVQDGIITNIQWQSGYGNVMEIQHDSNGDGVIDSRDAVESFYSHIDIDPNLKVGDKVLQGQQIAQISGSGTDFGTEVNTLVETGMSRDEAYRAAVLNNTDEAGNWTGGSMTSPHLHFERRVNNTATNPDVDLALEQGTVYDRGVPPGERTVLESGMQLAVDFNDYVGEVNPPTLESSARPTGRPSLAPETSPTPPDRSPAESSPTQLSGPNASAGQGSSDAARDSVQSGGGTPSILSQATRGIKNTLSGFFGISPTTPAQEVRPTTAATPGQPTAPELDNVPELDTSSAPSPEVTVSVKSPTQPSLIERAIGFVSNLWGGSPDKVTPADLSTPSAPDSITGIDTSPAAPSATDPNSPNASTIAPSQATSGSGPDSTPTPWNVISDSPTRIDTPTALTAPDVDSSPTGVDNNPVQPEVTTVSLNPQETSPGTNDDTVISPQEHSQMRTAPNNLPAQSSQDRLPDVDTDLPTQLTPRETPVTKPTTVQTQPVTETEKPVDVAPVLSTSNYTGPAPTTLVGKVATSVTTQVTKAINKIGSLFSGIFSGDKSTQTPSVSEPGGINGTEDTVPLSFNLRSQVTTQNGTIVTPWTTAPITLTSSQEIAFTWYGANDFSNCTANLHPTNTGDQGKLNQTIGNTANDAIDLQEKTGNYSLTCTTASGVQVIESISVTVN